MSPINSPQEPASIVQLIPLVVASVVRSDATDGRTAGEFVLETLSANGIEVQDRDVVVVSSKVASIFEGGQIHVETVVPSRKARVLGRLFRRDPRKIQLVLEQGSVFLVVPMKRIIRLPSMRSMLEKRSANPAAMRRGFEQINSSTFVVRKHAAYLDEAGIDHTNSPDGFVTVLPDDPCDTARRIRETVRKATDREIAVIITDTVTRVERLGSQDVGIGYSGIDPITRVTFSDDLFGTPRSGGIDLAIDSIAGMAGLVMGQTTQRRPVVLIRGLDYAPEREDEGGGMEVVAMPPGSEWRIALYTILATLKFKLGSVLAFQRNPRRPRAHRS